jgi:hypothetical protein
MATGTSSEVAVQPSFLKGFKKGLAVQANTCVLIDCPLSLFFNRLGVHFVWHRPDRFWHPLAVGTKKRIYRHWGCKVVLLQDVQTVLVFQEAAGSPIR